MRPFRFAGALAIGALALTAACSDTSGPAAPADPPSPQFGVASQSAVNVIVTLDPSFAGGNPAASRAAAQGIARSLGVSPTHAYGTALFGFAGAVPEGRLIALERDPRVLRVERDQVVTLAPPPGKGPGGGGGGSPSQTKPWGISRVNGGVSGVGRTAWIIDSGIDLDHPDLTVDVGRSADFTGSRKGPEDENGHGTHVAGTVAAKDNDIGVIGVAAGATVVAVRVLDRRGSGSYSGVIAGVDYVAEMGSAGDVANMSLGGPVSATLDQAVVNAAASSGVLFVLAAGNESDDANNHSPARANGTNVYTISAFAQGDTWASFSNYGNPPIDFAGPGVSVLSTYKDGGYATASGTSMAAPHVAGVLLLGPARSGGTVSGDPSGPADVIAVR